MGQPRRFTVDQVREAYEANGRSIRATARALGCTDRTVRRYLEEAGWERGTRKGAISRPEPPHVVRVEVGYSGLLGARVVFDRGFEPLADPDDDGS